jgi:hypothetical protein
MPPLDAYLSPQSQQAVIAGLFLSFGWVVVAWQARRRDARIRREREADIQRALLAEIRAHVVSLEQQSPSVADAEALISRIRSGDFIPTLPQLANDRIFGAVITELHILPAPVIDPIVIYYRLLSIMGALATDLRQIPSDGRERAAQMMADYLSLMDETRDSGIQAIRVLTECLRGGADAVEKMLDDDEAAAIGMIAQQLPTELGEMRDRLDGINNRSSDQRGR